MVNPIETRDDRLRHRAALIQRTAALELRAAQLLVDYQTHVYTQTLWTQPERLVWTNMVMPTELFYAFGLVPVHTELTAGWISSLRLASTYIPIAQQRGFHVGLCSYHKAIIGAMESGALPPPRLAVASSHICDGGSGLLQYFRHRFGTKTLLMDIPYQQQSPAAVARIVSQLHALVRLLMEYTGQPVAPHALAQAIRHANEERAWMQAANHLRRASCLLYGNQALRNLFGSVFLSGSPLGTEVARAYHQQLWQRSRHKGDWVQPARPIRRILWVHFAPLYAGDWMTFFEQTLGCVIAMDVTGHVYWPALDETAPLESLARKMLSHFYLWDSAKRLRLFARLLEEYRIDGVVLFAHTGCRAIPGAAWELRLLAERHGLGFLELPGDCIDPRGASSAQIKLRMEAFRESLDRREKQQRGAR